MCLHSVLKQVHRQVVVIFMRKSFLFLSNRATQLDAMCKNMISYFSTSNLPLYLEDFSSLKDLMNIQLFFHTGGGMGSMIPLNGYHLPGLTSWLDGTENLIQCVWTVALPLSYSSETRGKCWHIFGTDITIVDELVSWFAIG